MLELVNIIETFTVISFGLMAGIYFIFSNIAPIISWTLCTAFRGLIITLKLTTLMDMG